MESSADLLHAEGRLVKALPKMASAATAPRLTHAFADHLEETRAQVERLKEVFSDWVGRQAETVQGHGRSD